MIDADTERDETPDIERELEHHRLVTLLQTSALAGDLLAQSKHKMSPMEPERMEDDHWSFPRFGSGLATDFDAVFGGFQGLTILCGRWGAGKSMLALACALTNAARENRDTCVVYFDAEHTAGQRKPDFVAWFGGSAQFQSKFPWISHRSFFWVRVKKGQTWEHLMDRVVQSFMLEHERVLIVLDSVVSICRKITVYKNSHDRFRAWENLAERMHDLTIESQGKIACLALTELNADGVAQGRSIMHIGDCALAVDKAPEVGENAVRLNLDKNRGGPARDLGVHERDWRTCTFRKWPHEDDA